jgi:glutamate racemase
VRTSGCDEPVRLTFANAAPANDYGYNSMPTRAMKIETFDRFLNNVMERFSPDCIYVACNTLSVLMPDTPFVRKPPVPIKGIVETGVQLIAGELDPRAVAMIFGTQTTIDSGVYPHLLERLGIDASRIVTQACPGLADVISEDREGSRTRAEIRRWVDAASEKLHDSPPVVACLACTHYGYRKNVFAGALADAGICAKVIDPNERAVGDLFDSAGGKYRSADVQFVTRYAIPQTTIDALTFFLQEISPKTVQAMQNFVHAPDLF